MSERKVLNKYYPPDFDPSKIPRMKLPRNRQYTVRLMAPFNMRCVTCGEYIYKGKKFNARKEDVEGEDYLGIRIYRFYIKCTRCLQEISFKTDPRNTDYEIEAGATRNFMALKLAEEQAQREEDERKEDEATNPMKLLENRTKQSKQELELLESLEELRDLNRRQRLIDYDSMLSQYDGEEARRRAEQAQEEEDEKFIRSVFGTKDGKAKVVEEEIIELNEKKGSVTTSTRVESNEEPLPKVAKMSTNSVPTSAPVVKTAQVTALSSRAPGKASLAGLVRPKQAPATSKSVPAVSQSASTVSKPVLVVSKRAPAVSSSVPVVSSPAPAVSKPAPTDSKPAPTALSMLGAYSDSDGD